MRPVSHDGIGLGNRSGDGELAQFPPSHEPLDLCSPFQLCPLFSCAGDKDHPRYVEPPVIPGHEFIGEVVKLGKGEQ